ncbi:hypothetical protein [Phyllobacterium calauticae]|jgi:hypothetical protein|uniref:hypothetical protein n=1 Tax=Phyllobacterium calauticae TaxID=2817027 RepID=UPI001CBDEA13|nr:hypothetical protein [Phyllobacterium calauticae]MBZ3691003.1 hypothetical protein [Phyllobacterium calauticae]
MTSFALITEGITDQVILEHIIEEYYDAFGSVDVYVNHIQPLRDATDASRQDKESLGGWEKVLEQCSISKTITDCFAHNEYIVIQIDTDCGDHPNFGVPLTLEGADRAVADIIQDTKNLIINKIGSDLYEQDQDKFIFAVSVHSLDCWVLSFHAKTTKEQTKNCAGRLKIHLSKSDERFSKDYNCYKALAKPIHGKELLKIAETGTSLGIFLSSLPALES